MMNGTMEATPRAASWKMLLQCLTVLLPLMLYGAGRAQAAEAASAAAPSASCLVKPAKGPQYPERENLARTGAWLRFKLTFTRPDRGPDVELLTYNGTTGLLDEAKMYLSDYRLPCLPQGQQLSLEQVVTFEAIRDEHVNLDTGANAALLRCMRTPEPIAVDEEGQSGSRLFKPKQAGKLLVELTFTAPDAPPQIKTLYASGNSRFLELARDAAAQYRVPCLTPDKTPFEAQQLFSFEGTSQGKTYVLKDMDLASFLRAVKDVDKTPVHFELGTMACPFKVTWALYQPVTENAVQQIGPRVPERQPLLAWLEKLTFDLNPELFDKLLGARTVITIPCGTVDL